MGNMRANVRNRTCPRCLTPVRGWNERCDECQQLLEPPPPLPLLRRPGAIWALTAIMLGLLGAISGGVLAVLAVPVLVLAWRCSTAAQAQPLCHGVRSLVGIGLLATVLGMGIGLWSLLHVDRSMPAASSRQTATAVR